MYPLARWRLLNTGAADGATNMAIDQAILQAVAAQLVPPTLRFYAWQPPCLSLGQAQASSEVDWAACAARGYDVVRRPTGGRAILHTDELTYSVTALETEPRVAGGITPSYRRLSEGLLEGLRVLGVPGLEAHPPQEKASGATRDDPAPSTSLPSGEMDRAAHSPLASNPVCFEVPSTYEITVGNKKLVGSAQVRREGVILQHGALPLVGDIARICDVLTPRPDPARVRARATTVESVLGRVVSFDEAVRAIARGFASVFNLDLAPGNLFPQELAWAQELRRERYASDEWNRRL